jgi:hypothetical protein
MLLYGAIGCTLIDLHAAAAQAYGSMLCAVVWSVPTAALLSLLVADCRLLWHTCCYVPVASPEWGSMLMSCLQAAHAGVLATQTHGCPEQTCKTAEQQGRSS